MTRRKIIFDAFLRIRFFSLQFKCVNVFICLLDISIIVINWNHLPVWILLCIFNDDFCVNRFIQTSHTNGRSPVWILMCISRYGFLQNAAGHISHWNGLPCTVLLFVSLLLLFINSINFIDLICLDFFLHSSKWC